MRLPNPVPDNPLKWDGWKNYNSDNPYERLCLDFESNPSAAQIEENWRLLLVWWQKKLPLKNQPSNPMAQLLRLGLDEAPVRLAEARTMLLDPETRAQIDSGVLSKVKEHALVEFNKFLSFALTSGALNADEEDSLYQMGVNFGLKRSEMEALINEELKRTGMKRVPRQLPPMAVASSVPAAAPVSPPSPPKTAPQTPREEFLRMLRMSGIDEITDDQRDAFCNMGEALGLSGGDAEDVIDEYLEERMVRGSGGGFGNASSEPAIKASAVPAPSPMAASRLAPKAPFASSPLSRSEEKKNHPPFSNTLGMQMLLVPSGSFKMGSNRPDAPANEQPVTPTGVSAFYMARWPVTNAQYEQFDPAHRAKRAPWANEHHPVIYVTAGEAARFCDWLGVREKRKYRLPTEAEWEYAARGLDGRTFPWGETLLGGGYANFADANTHFPWADRTVDDGFAETSPVGHYPRGAGPFGIEEMAGNVWEWCLDCMTPYSGKDRSNPRGPTDGLKRVCRGGSWKSRSGSLRTSARSFNAPSFSGNDVGFRVVCEIGTK